MLDIKFIKENKELVAKGAEDKRMPVNVDQIIELDASIRQEQVQLETLQAERNRISKEIGRCKSSHEREELKSQVADFKPKMDDLQEKLRKMQADLHELMLRVPTPARSDVPVGKDDSENVEIKTWGEKPIFDFPMRDHVELGELHGWIDIPRGVKLAGSRSYLLRSEAARLESALLQFTLDLLHSKGYEQLSVPVLVKEDCMIGTGYFPGGRDQAYYIEKDELALVGTAEVSIASMHSDEILDASKFPLRYMAQSSCFRREAGTHGKDNRGLYRVHQFQKIEQVIFAEASEEASEKLHEELLSNAEQVLQALELPYRVVYVCSGDLGLGQVRKHDIETWMPSRDAYSETHSCSTFHDFQARRLGVRYRDEKDPKQKQYCYTLNNTAIATPRVLIPFLEVHQQADGSIRIPEALRPYLKGQAFLGKKD